MGREYLKATLPRSKRLQTIVFLSKILHKALNTLLNLKTSKCQTHCIRTLVGAPLKMFGVFAILRKFTASPKVKKCKSLKRGYILIVRMIAKCLKFLTKHEKPNTHATKLAFLSRYLFGTHTDISGKCFKSLNSNPVFLNQNAFKPKSSLMLGMVKSCLVFKRISFQSFIWDILLSFNFFQNKGLQHQQQIRVRTITFARLEKAMVSGKIFSGLDVWSFCTETSGLLWFTIRRTHHSLFLFKRVFRLFSQRLRQAVNTSKKRCFWVLRLVKAFCTRSFCAVHFCAEGQDKCCFSNFWITPR